MDRKLWLTIAAGWSFFMAIFQTIFTLSPAAAEYFMGPQPVQQNRLQLLLIGLIGALILVDFGLYALSGAGIIRRLPLLRFGLIGISIVFLLRGLFIVLNLLVTLGVLPGGTIIQGDISSVVFLAAGLTYAIGTALNWKDLGRPR